MKLTSSPLMGDDSKSDKTSVLIKFRCGKSEDLPLLFSPASPQRKKLHLVFRCLNFEMIHRISQVNGPLFAACCSIAFPFDAGTTVLTFTVSPFPSHFVFILCLALTQLSIRLHTYLPSVILPLRKRFALHCFPFVLHRSILCAQYL